jgi:hypothetical protein
MQTYVENNEDIMFKCLLQAREENNTIDLSKYVGCLEGSSDPENEGLKVLAQCISNYCL